MTDQQKADLTVGTIVRIERNLMLVAASVVSVEPHGIGPNIVVKIMDEESTLVALHHSEVEVA